MKGFTISLNIFSKYFCYKIWFSISFFHQNFVLNYFLLSILNYELLAKFCKSISRCKKVFHNLCLSDEFVYFITIVIKQIILFSSFWFQLRMKENSTFEGLDTLLAINCRISVLHPTKEYTIP